MFETPYVIRNFKKLINYKDIVSDNALIDEAKRLKICQNTSVRFDSNSYFKNDLHKILVKNKNAYVFKDIENKIIERALLKNIKRTYKIKVKSRESIVSVLISLLKENCPYSIHRFDIIKFYESFNVEEIKKYFLRERNISGQSIGILDQLFKEFSRVGALGLPRGLASSSILSEVIMQSFDTKISRFVGVYYYARFVDDIIIVATPEVHKKKLEDFFVSNLPPGLKIHKNGEKRYFKSIGKTKDQSGENIKDRSGFDYLGYNFTPLHYENENDGFLELHRRSVNVDLAKSKIQKIKKRIMVSFFAFFKKDGKKELLENRIKYLTSNYYLFDPIKKKRIRSGIYYNYKHLNASNNNALKELDSFLKSLLFYKNGKISKRIMNQLSLTERRNLAQYSFQVGFKDRIITHFSYAELEEVKRCW